MQNWLRNQTTRETASLSLRLPRPPLPPTHRSTTSSFHNNKNDAKILISGRGVLWHTFLTDARVFDAEFTPSEAAALIDVEVITATSTSTTPTHHHHHHHHYHQYTTHAHRMAGASLKKRAFSACSRPSRGGATHGWTRGSR